MIEIVGSEGPWVYLHRPLKTTTSWPGALSVDDAVITAAGIALLDAHRTLNKLGQTDLIERVVLEAERAAVEGHGFTLDEARELRSSIWRSAHEFLTRYVHLVERTRELAELAELLGVDKE